VNVEHRTITSADHFLAGRTTWVGDQISAWLTALGPRTPG
jgi:hypothetical protein